MRIKHILFITTGDIAQIATMKRAFGLAKPLANLGWTIDILAEETKENKKCYELECDSRIRMHYYPKSNVFNEINFKNNLIAELSPSYIYLCSFSVRNFVFKRKSLLIIEHSELQSSIKNQKYIKCLMAYILESVSVIYADKLVCASKYLQEYFTGLSTKLIFASKDIHYSPYAYSNEVINTPPFLKESLKKKYNNQFICLYMGSMAENYGFFKMLEAMKLLKNYPIKLLLMGKGKDFEKGLRFVQENRMNNVELLGYVDEVELSSYFSITDAFISPLNNTVQDKARCPSKIYMYLPFKKPVLTCKIGEAFEIFGENGQYFEFNDSISLSNLIMKNYLGTIGSNVSSELNIEQHSWVNRALLIDNWL